MKTSIIQVRSLWCNKWASRLLRKITRFCTYLNLKVISGVTNLLLLLPLVMNDRNTSQEVPRFPESPFRLLHNATHFLLTLEFLLFVSLWTFSHTSRHVILKRADEMQRGKSFLGNFQVLHCYKILLKVTYVTWFRLSKLPLTWERNFCYTTDRLFHLKNGG